MRPPYFPQSRRLLWTMILAALLAVVTSGDSVELPDVPVLDASIDLNKFGVNDEQRLFKHIMRGYDPAVRPVLNASSVVEVQMGLTLTHIFNIDEKNQVLAVNVWVEQNWREERIRWRPEEYGNITKLTISPRLIWTPDIVLYNNARDFSRGFVQTNLHITSDGEVQYAPPSKVHSLCKMDVQYFPFDDQFCALAFQSWIYDLSQLDVTIVERYDGKAPFTRDSFTENGEWEIVANRTVRIVKTRGTRYSMIVFELHLRRRMLYFMYNIISPCLMLSVLTMMQFVLPCESGEKVTLGLTVLLAYSVFSFNIAEAMPETSEVVPLIAIYLMAIMAISSISVSFSVLILNMRHGAEHRERIPPLLRRFAVCLSPLLLLSWDDDDEDESTGEWRVDEAVVGDKLASRVASESRRERLTADWARVANVFDRLFFCIVFLTTLSTTVYLLLLAPRFNRVAFADRPPHIGL